jgi:hypothetical protein
VREDKGVGVTDATATDMSGIPSFNTQLCYCRDA